MHENVLNALTFEAANAQAVAIGSIDDKIAINKNWLDVRHIEVTSVNESCAHEMSLFSPSVAYLRRVIASDRRWT